MPKNDKVWEKKVTMAMNALMCFTGMKVHEAMDYAQFLKKEINDVNLHCIVSRRLFRAREATAPPKNIILRTDTLLEVLSLSMDADIAGMNVMTCIPIADIIPPPRHNKQRMTMCTLENKRIEDMKQKNHKSDAHKEARHLYMQEKAKLDGLSLWQVQEKIITNSVNIHYSTNCRYANEGLVGALPK